MPVYSRPRSSTSLQQTSTIRGTNWICDRKCQCCLDLSIQKVSNLRGFFIFLFFYLEKLKSNQTLLVWAGGQSSSLTPNVTPGAGFFSKGFLISPGMPFLHVPLSLGGLVSSACRQCTSCWIWVVV